MITGDRNITDNAIDLSKLDVIFTSKPLLFGGLVMEYYGLRKSRHDIDLIITNEDYQTLLIKYPGSKKDRWGDFGLEIGDFELWRSICKLEYDFYSEGAIEYETYKVMSFEKMFFMKAIAYDNEPEVQKHTDDFKIMIQYYYDKYQNKEYVEYMNKHSDKYLSVPYGIIYNDKY